MFFRPLRFGELIDGIYRSLRRTFWPIWWFIFLLNTPFLAIMIGGYYWSDSLFSIKIFVMLFICLFVFILYPLFQHGCTQVVMRQFQQEEPLLMKWYTPFIFALRKIWRIWIANGLLVGALIIVVMLITILISFPILVVYISIGAPWHGSIFPIVSMSGITSFLVLSYLWIRLSLTLPIASIERITLKEAFIRSWKLTDRAYFALCSKWIFLALLQLPILFVWIFFANPLESSGLFSVIICLLTSPIIFALGTVLLSFLYVDQRARKEAFDLQMLLMDRTDRGEA